MTDLIFAWENWRKKWYDFEDLIVELINDYHNNKNWKKIVYFIANDLWIENVEDYNVFAEKCPKSVKDAFSDSKKPPKADAHIYYENKKTWEKIKKWISIKSSNISIQVLITNVNAFLNVCRSYEIQIPELLDIALSKFCGFGNYKPSLMLPREKITNLVQWDRDRWLVYELEKKEQDVMENFFNENQKKISEIVLKKWSWEEEYWVDYYVANKNKYSDTWIVDVELDNITNIIDRSIKLWWYITTIKWSFHLWSLTVQMKWSWKWESYHWLQFNKSWI